MLDSGNKFVRISAFSGFSMLEVLITVLVLSVGLLGMAGLITTGMKSNATAHFRTIAIHQTQDIADRMRANLSGVRSGLYDSLTTAISTGEIPAGEIPTGGGCVDGVCDAPQMSSQFSSMSMNTTTTSTTDKSTTGTTDNSAIDCVATTCDASQMAVYDYEQWNIANANLLPNGQGTVAGDLTNGYVITIMWTERGRGGGCQGNVSAETRCFQTRFTP